MGIVGYQLSYSAPVHRGLCREKNIPQQAGHHVICWRDSGNCWISTLIFSTTSRASCNLLEGLWEL